MEEEKIKETEIIEDRKKKILNFFKSKQAWVFALLVVGLVLGIYIRSLPMTNHGDHPGLWDITTNTWALGPDLDPWLFLRYAKNIVENGSLPRIDMIRNVPLGFDTTTETPIVSYSIALTYYILHALDSSFNIEFAGVVFPVIMFAFTIIIFFLFAREIFIRKEKESIAPANIIAIISMFLMIVSPVFLSRTVAGIPEKESAAFFFMFLSFYLYLKAWKSEKLKTAIIFAIFAGVSTALMGLTWGGVSYIFIPIALASLIALVLNKVNKKELIVYFLWVLFSFSISLMFSNRFNIIDLTTSLDTGFSFAVLLIMIAHFILWHPKMPRIKKLEESKIPRSIISLIFAVLLIILIGLVLFGPNFFIEKIKVIHQTIFHPVTGRWSTTVAENRQPDFKEWSSSFGPFIKDIPVLFWLFFVGSIFLFKKMLDKIKKKEAWILTGFYVFFLLGMIFSRYSGSSIFNGENLISKLFYYSSAIIFIGFFVYYYFLAYKNKDNSFESIDYEFLILFSLFILTLFTARGAVRLIMVLAPIAPIFVGFLILDIIEKFKKSKDETIKIIFGALALVIIIASLFVFWNFYQQVKSESFNFVPSVYNHQWQKAMQWVRDETPKNAVFAHWWDYGYWVQSIGERATVLDGGNAIAFWNYYMGRLVLTGDNQADSLEFLYNHNATYLLIDSTDIGKYGAFASIGSDKNYDRYSWVGTFLLDEKQTQETNNQTISVYTGGIGLDEDIIINESGKEIFLPGQRTAVGAIILPMEKIKDKNEFAQPYVIMIYQGKQQKIKLRYLSANGKFIDFKSGIEGCAYIFPQLIQEGQGIRQNPTGAAMFLSPRLMRGYFAQKYILDDPFKKFPNFKLEHTEQSLIVDSLKEQGMSLPDFVYFNGVQGPIKIWNITYTGKERIKQEYLDIDYSKYLDWEL
jgi:asparagine N-glycosylation enzyme membrane subunit Stt3